jgi:CheY-like chemotaxis protein
VPVILRPLIATRVLAVLDDVFAAVSVSEPPATSVVLSFTPLQADLPSAPDDAPEQPANIDTAIISAAQGADVAAVVDAVLLSTPGEEPLVDIFSTSDETHEITEATAPAEHSKPRVLVVDDNPAVCKQLEIELRHFDVEIDFVPSARKAIELVGKHHYQMAFLDVVLPDWDGFQICKRIKSKTPDTVVVMLAGKSSASEKLRGALAGCNAYLLIPIVRQMFQAVVKDHLKPALSTQVRGA